MRNHRLLVLAVLTAACAALCACRSLYYAAYEKVGLEKRHLLKRNVEKVQEEQTEAAQEFKDVLTRVKELYGFDGGELETVYKKLGSDYEGCADRAESIRDRVRTVNQIGADLFSEWEKEIGEISTPALRAKSETSMRDARRRFEALQAAMERSESRLDPVLTQLHDYVLYLKHNLNAQAVGAMQGEVGAIERDVNRLVEDMNRCVEETRTFLKDFE